MTQESDKMITIQNRYKGELITLLAPVPTTIGFAIKKAFFSLLWFSRDPRTTKSFDKMYYGLIEHKCEFDMDKPFCDRGGIYRFYRCKHYGCNMVEPEHL